MNQNRTEEIRAREQAATHGPWQYDGMHNEIQTPNGDDFWLIISELRRHEGEKLIDRFGHTYNPNFEFIAHARQDVPALLDALEAEAKRADKWERRYRETSEHLDEVLSGNHEWLDIFKEKVTELQADRDQWKAKVEAIKNSGSCTGCVNILFREHDEDSNCS